MLRRQPNKAQSGRRACNDDPHSDTVSIRTCAAMQIREYLRMNSVEAPRGPLLGLTFLRIQHLSLTLEFIPPS